MKHDILIMIHNRLYLRMSLTCEMLDSFLKTKKKQANY